MAAMGSFMPIIIMVLIFYFLLYRPQKKAREAHDAMLAALKVGNRVVTIGGIYGTITSLNENVVTLKIADRVEIEVARASINGVDPNQANDSQ